MTTTAVRLHPAWDDPDATVALIRDAGPFWPLANYAGNDAELAAIGGPRTGVVTPPWFRQDFALGGAPLVDGADVLLANRHFADGARAVYGPDAVVRPTSVYVNLMGPTPFAFPAHLDVPAFRGFTRADHPIWLLKVMMASGLFERWRTRIATAVSWFYDGPGGEFHYWPAGPDEAERLESPPYDNVAVVADNEATFHGVGRVGPPEARMTEGVTTATRLVRGDGGWDVCDPEGAAVAHLADAEVRITVSWKADVLADEAEARRVDAGADHLDLDRVVDRFRADLASRGVTVRRPDDPHADEAWTAALADAYPERAPAIRWRGGADRRRRRRPR